VLDAPQALQAVHARHAHVAHDDVGPLAVDRGQALLAAGRHVHIQALPLQLPGQELADPRVVVDEEHAHGSASWARGYRGRGRSSAANRPRSPRSPRSRRPTDWTRRSRRTTEITEENSKIFFSVISVVLRG